MTRKSLLACSFSAFMGIFLFSPIYAWAIEPTALEPADTVEYKTLEIEEEIRYQEFDDHIWQWENEISYGFTPHLQLGVFIPVEFEEGENGELDDSALFLEFTGNPEASLIWGGEIQLIFPTSDESDSLGGAVQLRLTKPFGPNRNQAFHLNLTEYYDTVSEQNDDRWFERHCFCHDDDESKDEEFRFGCAAGYSLDLTEYTALILDYMYEQDYEGFDDASLAEIGIAHDFSPGFSLGLGAAAGLTSDSPDFEVSALLRFAFGERD